MQTTIFNTKFFIPPLRHKIVQRPNLIKQIDQSISYGSKLTLLSASAGFGKTTLLSEWIAESKRSVAWLTLDDADNDPVRFLTCLITALQTIVPTLGLEVLSTMQSSPLPTPEKVMPILLNEIATISDHLTLVFDDFHVIESKTIDNIIISLLGHMPSQMHLIIATREDPSFPLARLRACGQLVELRTADLRFSLKEVTTFLNQLIGLNLSAEDIETLDNRTEGWIAGLQLAAISMQGYEDVTGFIKSFTDSNHYILDYLVEEVLQQQPEEIQTFLLYTSILDRLCSQLCDAILNFPVTTVQNTVIYQAVGQSTLEYLRQANLFITPLDNERRWYRYHHLFAELLRQQLGHYQTAEKIADLHCRASQWYEEHDLEIEAFRHAVAANDIERAELLIEKGSLPLHSLAVVTALLSWLDSLPKAILAARPWLWVKASTSALMTGKISDIEVKLQAAEVALDAKKQNGDYDDRDLDLVGQIAAIRATLAIINCQPETAYLQAKYSLGNLSLDNQQYRSRATWAIGVAHQLQGDRVSANKFLQEAIQLAAEDNYYRVLSLTSLAQIQESENDLFLAAKNYQHSLQLLNEMGSTNTSEEHIGLARIYYEWNDLVAAEYHGQQSLQRAREYDQSIDRFIISEVFLARISLSRGDASGAEKMLRQAHKTAKERGFTHQLPEITAVLILSLIRQGQLTAAARLAIQYELPLSQTRVLIAQDDPAAALAVLESFYQQVKSRGWADQQLKSTILEIIALSFKGDKARAMKALTKILEMAERGGFIRLFLDEGEPMASILTEAAKQGIMPEYVGKLLDAFKQEMNDEAHLTREAFNSAIRNDFIILMEPLSRREMEILKLIALGLSNREIGERLFLALDTVKGHNRKIFDKLQVARRTEAIVRGRELGLL